MGQKVLIIVTCSECPAFTGVDSVGRICQVCEKLNEELTIADPKLGIDFECPLPDVVLKGTNGDHRTAIRRIHHLLKQGLSSDTLYAANAFLGSYVEELTKGSNPN